MAFPVEFLKSCGPLNVAAAWCPAYSTAFRVKDLLHPEEMQEWAGIRSPQRAAEWLAARRALKYLAWEMLSVRRASACRTLKNRFGVPWLQVVRGWRDTIYPCSISHSGGLGAAALGTRRVGAVGCDVQKVTPTLVRRQHVFVHPQDRLGVRVQDLWRCGLLWACKEAVAKAVGLGLALDFVAVRVEGKGAGRFTVRGLKGVKDLEGVFFMIPPVWVGAVVWLPGPFESPSEGSENVSGSLP